MPQETVRPMGEHASSRAVRVFVSSTFADMVAERDELARRVFPALRELCEARGVAWAEVDLRWGITDERAAEGQVLPVCLEEIDRCRPWFIGLLGERYGWVVDVVPTEVAQREPRLATLRSRSVTELEMTHGALNDPAAAEQAFFYFRDPGYATGPAVSAAEEADSAEEAGTARLAALKDRIRASGLSVREGYCDAEALGDLVLADLSAAIDRRFPAGSEPSPLDRDAAVHTGFARQHAEGYVARAADLERLDRHATEEGPPLVLTGDSGIGKSALLSAWTLRRADPGAPVVVHFVDAAPESADQAAMLRRLIGELCRQLDFDMAIPTDIRALRYAFAEALRGAGARGRVVLVLDGLDKLEDQPGSLDLAWLPETIPSTVRLFLSTPRPERPGRELASRGWPQFAVRPLDLDERRRFVVEFLRPFGKELAPAQLERVAGAARCANPRFLSLLLEELRLHPLHDTLSAWIDELVSARSILNLYDRILARWEHDYDRGRDGLVRDALVRLFASRRGLSEPELRDLLGTPDAPLPARHWSPLRIAARQTLISRSGQLDFMHHEGALAVAQRYLPRAEDQRLAYRQLADQFASSREPTSRILEELPWLLMQAEAWQELRDVLVDPRFMAALADVRATELRAYWARLEASSPHRLVDAYRPVIAAAGPNDAPWLWPLGALLLDTGHRPEALDVYRRLEGFARTAGSDAHAREALHHEALILYAQGELDSALAIHRELERFARAAEDKDALQRALGHQALIIMDRGDLDGAMALMEEQERLAREIGRLDALRMAVSNQAQILKVRGRADEAMRLYQQEQRIARELGDPVRVLHVDVNMAGIAQAVGELDIALGLLERAERLARELGDPEAVAAVLGNRAVIMVTMGRLDDALSMMGDQERIARELGDLDGLQKAVGNQGMILYQRGELDGALARYREKERICRELGKADGLMKALGNQALVLKDQGKLDAALKLHQEEEQLCHALGDAGALQKSIGNQAMIRFKRGDLDGALAGMREKERICRQLHHLESLGIALINQAAILDAKGDRATAIRLAAEALALAEDHQFATLADQCRTVSHELQRTPTRRSLFRRR